ncbi:BnaA01g12970D [Brassica napus]|uniref:BnaA01g12970D protein n=1 Tax=Brassica napus TaxID=3708 RepID=A0A078HTQ5_BRANA|nr:BnaA01g12970D [Brassica napus]
MISLLVSFWFVLISTAYANTCLNRSGFFAPDGTYDLNRRVMLSTLPSNVTANDGFYTTSTGQDPNRVYGLGMCVPEDVSSTNYAAGRVTLESSNTNIYGFMQCSRDISPQNCTRCLQQNVIDYRSCCRGRQGGTVSRPSCFLRWEIFAFLGLPENIPPPERDEKSISTGTIVAIVIVPIILLALGFGIWRKRKSYKAFTTESEFPYGYFSAAKRLTKTYNTAPPDNAGDDISTSGSLQFDFKAIEAATSNFHNTNKLGHGGFGEVYKGTFPNGTEIAVKRLSKTSGQGEREFKNEVLLVAKLQHRNLVRLLGFCVQGEEKILVYEFLPNKSLNYFLFGDSTKRIQLDWTRRYKIIGGVTRGILYLHQDSRLTIIHRDLKASNILLDVDMNPKIADFGMARNFRMDQTEDNTGRVVGTFGYMPPEYVANGQFSTKSDVYSFGVLILEIIGGKKNSSFHEIDGSTGNLVTYVWRLWNNDSLFELVDPIIGDYYDKYEVIRCVHIGVRAENIPLAESFQPDPSTSISVACSVNDVSITAILVIPESATFRFISASRKRLPALKSWMIVSRSSLLLPNKNQASLPNFYAEALPQQQLHSLTLFHLVLMSSIATSPQLVFHYEMYSTMSKLFYKESVSLGIIGKINKEVHKCSSVKTYICNTRIFFFTFYGFCQTILGFTFLNACSLKVKFQVLSNSLFSPHSLMHKRFYSIDETVRLHERVRLPPRWLLNSTGPITNWVKSRSLTKQKIVRLRPSPSVGMVIWSA